MSTLTAAVNPLSAVLHRWPAALGVLLAVENLVTDVDRDTLAVVVGVAVVCYLAAAALDRRWVSWAAIAGAGLVIPASELTGVPWWVGIGLLGLALVVAGLILRVPRPPLTAQAAALLGYGGLAVATLFVVPTTAGLLLAGLVLASHGVWDIVHWWRDRVVSRSLAEFCVMLDIPLGLGAVAVAILS
jgi:hypothetical protein